MTEAEIHQAVVEHLKARCEPGVFGVAPLTEEIWKPVVGWERFYAVSDLGRVKRIAPDNSTFVGRILRPLISGRGSYHCVQLCRPGIRKTLKIHRLVLAAFDPLFTEDWHTDHINGDTSDNRLSNLRRVTNEQNAKNRGAYRTNLFGMKGITFRRGYFEARIQADGKRLDLGRFKTLDEAVAAYREASIKYHGKFARAA